MKTRFLFSPAAPDDWIRLLRAWRFWLVGAVAGALLGTLAFYLAPSPYRARATVIVDFHLEQAWPQNTDREQFYYLERETRKLEDIAMSDATLQEIARQVPGVSIQQLRSGKLQLSQPGNGGWHFYASDADAGQAGALAGVWAEAFIAEARAQIAAAPAGGLEPYITFDAAQTRDLPASRSPGRSAYMIAGAVVLLAVAALGILFIGPRA
jgi:hypothetical protein